MGFFLGSVKESAAGGWTLLGRAPVRLAGPEGPLARHVLGLGEESDGTWQLSGEEIIQRLAVAPGDEGKPLLMWDPGDPEALPQRVVSIAGVSAAWETELLVQMEVLSDVEGRLVPTGRKCGEALRITGGLQTPRATWRWTAPKMGIGSTTLG
jgi:hypothetical protein